MKIFKFIIAFILILFLGNCHNNSSNNKKEKMETLIDTVSKNKTGYIIHVNALSPYELYLDDILINFYFGNNISNTIELNPYLLKNGKHKIRIKFFPKLDSKDHLLSPKDIQFNETAKWHIYFSEINLDPDAPLGYSNEIDYDKSELNIVLPSENVPIWEQKWEVEIKDLPYELKGWSESQDLRKMDQDLLKKEVLLLFTKYKNLLNEGKIDAYLKLGFQMDQDLNIATYATKKQSQINYAKNVELMSKLCPGNMQEIDNFKMQLFADGRLVTLLIPDGKLKNWSPLMSITPKGRKNYYRVLLHKPVGSSDFEIIRK